MPLQKFKEGKLQEDLRETDRFLSSREIREEVALAVVFNLSNAVTL